ncbi:fibroblast growth factor 1-like [Actinia tenebrosa]|uniref:Fibroblast growth factor n=1 Tax=Actinia tenebrosa TaxID=6105 RepID=A0A6P8HRG1_ACTTE|nr:fibroblast growth factor 1-like [Actinia tenebrosa]XP_031558150.1 fibroblast growth factor 1-like [Actinia tenebrosa]XP_031558151.1 fibroblast growth factor 1-like [Actinia tenebrosa]
MTMDKQSDSVPYLPSRSTSTYSRKRRLYCTNGLYLEINHNGRVKGTMNEHSPLVVMEIVPAGTNLVCIRSVYTGLFLAMSEGEVYTTKTENEECVFKDTLSKQFCDNYMSKKYLSKKLVIGLMRTGSVVAVPANSAKDTTKYATQFITKLPGT